MRRENDEVTAVVEFCLQGGCAGRCKFHMGGLPFHLQKGGAGDPVFATNVLRGPERPACVAGVRESV
jgi:hypothetical protein